MANNAPFTKKPHNRRYYWDEERRELMPLPPVPYEYMERWKAKVCLQITMFASTTLITA